MLRERWLLHEGLAPLLPQSRHRSWELRGPAHPWGWSVCTVLRAPHLLPCFSRRLGESQPPAAQIYSNLAWNCVSGSPRAKALAHGEEISSWETHGRDRPFFPTALSGWLSSFTQFRGCFEVVAWAWHRGRCYSVSTPLFCPCSSK